MCIISYIKPCATYLNEENDGYETLALLALAYSAAAPALLFFQLVTTMSDDGFQLSPTSFWLCLLSED